jgi:hypothetical protein
MRVTIGLFDFMQLCADRSAADLKQCMPVRNVVRLDTAPTPRDCDVCHQNTARAIREQPENSASAASEERLLGAARALMTTQLFHDWPDSPHDNDHVRFVFILTPLVPLKLTNQFFITVNTLFM